MRLVRVFQILVNVSGEFFEACDLTLALVAVLLIPLLVGFPLGLTSSLASPSLVLLLWDVDDLLEPEWEELVDNELLLRVLVTTTCWGISLSTLEASIVRS